MRVWFGLVVANLLMLGAGGAVLIALGAVRPRARDLVVAAGPAFLAGVAASMLVQILLLVLGFDVRFWLGALTCVVTAAAAVPMLLRRRGPTAESGPAEREPRRTLRERLPTTPEGMLALVVGLAASAVVLIFVWRSFQAYRAAPVANFDEFAIWSKKAFALYYLGGLDPAFFANPVLNSIHLEYPMLLPTFEAFIFRGMGRLDTGLVHAELLLLFIAVVWTFAWLVTREQRTWIWAPMLLALAVSPLIQLQLITGLADVTMASFAALGALCVGLWLASGTRWHLFLGSLYLAAASNTKLEGLLVAILALATACIIGLLARRPGRGRDLLWAGAIVLVSVLPWQIWVRAHPDIQSFFEVGHALNPVFLWNHLDRVPSALRRLDVQIAEPNNVLFLVPLGLTMTIVAIVTGVDRILGAFYLGLGLLVVVAILWIDVVQPGTWSADRVISAPAMIAVAGLFHLSARAQGRYRADFSSEEGVALEQSRGVTAVTGEPAASGPASRLR